MTSIEKLEKALKLAKDLKLNDNQVEELFSLILGLPITRVTWQYGPNTPYVPYAGGTILWNGTTDPLAFPTT